MYFMFFNRLLLLDFIGNLVFILNGHPKNASIETEMTWTVNTEL